MRHAVSRAAALQGVELLAAGEDVAALLGSHNPSASERVVLFDNVAHYRYRLRVGAGEHDVVTLHRVVKEDWPWWPSRASRAVFMVHGDGWGFEAAFLSSAGSAHVPPEQSLAAYLAKEGVDVWGIDLRWAGVHQDTQDFRFMKRWTLETHASDVGVGLGVARLMRLAGGNFQGTMHLMGWSRGAVVSYAYLNQEARLPRTLRQVDGFIPVDMAVRFAPEHAQQQQWACERYAALSEARQEGQLEGGLLGPAPGVMLQTMGQLAALQPNEPSPLVQDDIFGPGTGRPTNRKLAIVAAGATSVLSAPLQPIVPAYHLFGSMPDALGLPEQLTFTQDGYMFEFGQRAAPYQSLNEVVETEAWACGAIDVPYDDRLHEVKVPVLYVGAAGGVGRYGVHSVSLLGSHDVTVHIVSTLPEAAHPLDYGHADLFLADDARVRVWKPMLQWIRTH
ncbi:hypothetical protein [Myxococcus sp. Y35]|uniref:hypothetical protein n=1 Tax=Pseudomyxococcus flavus TaxID=3115648 RepID=UPI003CF2AE87